MTRVLLVDDDAGIRATVGAILRLNGHPVSAASTARRGIDVARTFHPDVALVDLRLPDASGLDVVSELRVIRPSVRCVIVTGFADVTSAVDAIRRGACDYLQKPVGEADILAAVSRAGESPDDGRREIGATPVPVPHDLTRWSEAIVRFRSSPRDVKTLGAFGRAVGVSTGAFRNWCRTAGLSSRRSLQFARGLRAVELRQLDGSTRPQKFLDIVDLRTLSKFLLASGGTPEHLPSTVDEYLRQQQFVNDEAADAVRGALSNGGSLPHSQPASSHRQIGPRATIA